MEPAVRPELDKHLSTCKRAMQRDKGPNTTTKQVKLDSIGENEWQMVTKNPNEPRRVVWSFAWAVTWMLRAVEAAQLTHHK